ncbi:MFS transporter [Actinocrinis sp.]|uniref:MFS transporter n=1 Tax=Actinocrinis sp. TaxID=1920516 RepID=UPI002D26ED1B|nr:MFS transporter [Actinocrinis sp.]HZP54065.1 MFS transporter [Actinocrinis sp.]
MSTPPSATVSASAPAPATARQCPAGHAPNTDVSRSAPRRIVFLLAFACALTVANLYYCQPLLPEIAKSFSASQSATGGLVTANQLGYGVALLLIVPLGDITNRRRLVCGLLVIEAAALAGAAAAPNLALLLAASAAVGIAACVVQILLPYAATIAGDHERGRVTGTVLSGLLIGILLSRTVAGLIGQAFGWRTVFAAAGVLMLLLSAVLLRAMEAAGPEVAISYREQLRATARLARSEPVLRRRSVMGGLMFAAFGLFWATVSFLLAGSPFHYNQAGIGLFALVGGAGALAAKLTGHAADRGHERATTVSLLVLGLASFCAIALGHANLAWLLVGVLFMDAAVQGVNLLNLSVVYNLSNGARARIASVYMTTYFVLGALGSAAGTEAYHYGGWGGVSAVGGGFVALALALFLSPQRRR